MSTTAQPNTENSSLVEIDLSGNKNLSYKAMYSLLNLAK